MADNSELFSTLIQGLSALNQRVNDLEGDNDSIKKEINYFQNEYAKEIKLLHERVDHFNVQIDKTIKDEISKIEIKDGKDGVDFDSKVANGLITAQINKLVKKRDLEVEKIKTDLLNVVVQELDNIPIPKDGPQGPRGESVSLDLVEEMVSSWLNDNKDDLVGPRGIQGNSGPIGLVGVSITDAKIVNDFLVLTFSDGSVKRVKMPKQKIIQGGGGYTPDNFSYDFIDKAIEIPYNQQMIVMGGIDIESELLIDGRLILEH